ncbi:MAG: hypothetical protein FGM23_07575, partial [Alphaproteobacteria bacterium]|nr:hypothetical protein [Alphaproteobacteria bacterium]
MTSPDVSTATPTAAPASSLGNDQAAASFFDRLMGGRIVHVWPQQAWPLVPMLIALVSVPAAAKLSVLWLPMAAILALLVGPRPADGAAWGRVLPLILLLGIVWAGLSLLWTPNVDNGLRAFLDTASLALAGGILLSWLKQTPDTVKA